METPRQILELQHTIFCDDVRLEVGNKLSAMGIFSNLVVPQLPITMMKFAVINHWSGEGEHLSEVRILSPDRTTPLIVSMPTKIEVPVNGYADNITFFANVTFTVSGNYVVQTLINSSLFAEKLLPVAVAQQQTMAGGETIN